MALALGTDERTVSFEWLEASSCRIGHFKHRTDIFSSLYKKIICETVGLASHTTVCSQ